MLQGCAQLEDPLAIIHILTAAYLAELTAELISKDIASLFPRTETVKYRKTLEELGAKSKTFELGPEALTLQGLFLEREGKKEKAKSLYVEAVERSRFDFNPKRKHPMQLPLMTPWNALGYLLKADKDPNVRAQARIYFERGALEGDDPLSCYEASAFFDISDLKWLQYTSKAAASGHRQATVNLAQFYQDASLKESPVLADSKMRKALRWVLGWRRDSVKTLAHDWLHAASIIGHKPSMLQCAERLESQGHHDEAKTYWRRMSEPPTGLVEEWPQLAQLAKKRLAGIKV